MKAPKKPAKPVIAKDPEACDCHGGKSKSGKTDRTPLTTG